MTDVQVFLTPEECERVLPDGEMVHTFRASVGLFGADWSRDDILKQIRSSDVRELSGPFMRSLKHGLALHEPGGGVMFVATDEKRLAAFELALTSDAVEAKT